MQQLIFCLFCSWHVNYSKLVLTSTSSFMKSAPSPFFKSINLCLFISLKNVFGADFIDFIFNKNEDVQINTVFEYFACQLQNKKYLIAVYKRTFVMSRIPF